MAPRRADRVAATEKERYHGFHGNKERAGCFAFFQRRGALGRRGATRSWRGGGFLLFRAHDGRLLPSVLRGASCAARKRPLPFELRRSGSGRVPPMQALPAERGRAQRATR